MVSFFTFEMVLRLVVALVLGALVGIERETSRQTAGLRTHALVSMGAALFVVVSEMVTAAYGNNTSLDPTRIASQIVVGVGFISAGVIIFRDSVVRGLTTAAGLWVAAGIGVATGFGFYTIAVIATLLVLFLLSVVGYLEKEIFRRHEHEHRR